MLSKILFTLFLSSFALANADSVPHAKGADRAIRIVALGDSVTAGYGVAKKDAYPALLEKRLKSKFPNVKVVNAGISGATTASALGNIKWQLRAKPELLILCLGGNDGLRGLDLEKSKTNLSKAIELAQSKNIKVLLVGMKIPKNYGKDYNKQFEAMYPNLAKKYKIPLVPFLLENVGGVKELNLPDGIHPNEKGYLKVVENVLPYVEKLLL